MNKIISFILILFCYLNVNSQVIRFNVNEGALGVQTPHKSKVYSHLEIQLLNHPLFSDVHISRADIQIAIPWVIKDRATIRTGAQLITYGLSEPVQNTQIHHYFDIIPMGITIYPFDREYFGVDLFNKFDIITGEMDVNLTLLVRIK